MKTGYQVADVMTIKPVVVTPGTTLQECAALMAKYRIGTLIIEMEKKLLGMVNDTDIIRNVLAKGINPLNVMIEDVMQTKIITITPNQDMYDALQLMKKYSIRTLPVVDGGKLVGLLTLKDILKIEPTLFDTIVEKIELREETRKPINRIIEKEGICQLCGSYSEEVVEEDSTLVCPKCRS